MVHFITRPVGSIHITGQHLDVYREKDRVQL